MRAYPTGTKEYIAYFHNEDNSFELSKKMAHMPIVARCAAFVCAGL